MAVYERSCRGRISQGVRVIRIEMKVCVLGALVACGSVLGADRQDVVFQISNNTLFGQSVYVVGSLPELGSGDVLKAVKLEPGAYPLWKATISLPVNVNYTYRFYNRNDGPGQGSDPLNAFPISSVLNGSTMTTTLEPSSKTVFVHTGFESPILYWRQPGGAGSFQSIAMHDVGPAANGTRRWAARDFGAPRRSMEFYITDASGAQRDPPGSGTFTTSLDLALLQRPNTLQASNIYNYVPAPSVSGQTRDFASANPPGIQSTFTGEFRRHRVVLPRGYSSHPTKRYPVIYMHDGQNCFDSSTAAFGVEWRADETAAELTRLGQMREAIIVGADNTSNRLSDYAAPDAGGWADQRYFNYLRLELKPFMDATYRTLTSRNDTAAVGSSMGGQASLFLGWDHTGQFGRVGALSGAFEVFNSGFYNRVKNQPKRGIRVYLDSGDAGIGNSDNYWAIYNLRDNLMNPARADGVGGGYVIESDLRHVIGYGHVHNEAAWAARLPGAFSFLFPTSDEPNQLVGVPSARPADVNDDDLVTIDDLYAFEQGLPGPRSTTDVDRDGVAGEAEDRVALRGTLRNIEPMDVVTR